MTNTHTPQTLAANARSLPATSPREGPPKPPANDAQGGRAGATVLLTGFGPFDTIFINTSQVVAEHLDGLIIGGARVVSRILPVAFGRDAALLEDFVSEAKPGAILGLGAAPGTDHLRVETTARNIMLSKAGRKVIDESAPGSLAATIPTPAVAASIHATGVGATLSHDAGAFLCNHILFQALLLAQRQPGGPPVGFIHLPEAPEFAPVGQPSMPLHVIERGVRAAIAVLTTAATGGKRTNGHEPSVLQPRHAFTKGKR